MFALRSLRSWTTPLALAGIGAVGFALGTWNGQPTTAVAQTPSGPVIGAGGARPSDYKERIVATIYGNVNVSREELGEYLIARYGYEKVELMVNSRIIQEAAKKRGITVTDAEVEASIDEDLDRMKMDRATFVKEVLKRRRQTLYEFKEDQVRPTLMLKKMCQGEIKVEDAELQRAFEAAYGEKAKCRLIIFEDLRTAQHTWEKVRSSEAEFVKYATQQGNPQLASIGGLVDPIAHGVAKDNTIENIAFRLKPGEVSEIFALPNLGKTVCGVLRGEGRVPPAEDVTIAKKHDELYKVVFDQKVLQAIPIMFKQILKEADPKMFVAHVNHDSSIQRTREEEDKLLKEESKPVVPLPGQQPKPNK
jgi:hypothetical protein